MTSTITIECHSIADAVKPWERQPGEPTKAFHAFCHFRDLDLTQRTQGRAFTTHQRGCRGKAVDPKKVLEPNTVWKTWRRKWNWETRAEAHDREVDAALRRARLKQMEEMNERHAGIAKVVIAKVIERLETFSGATLTPGQMALLMREATAIERRALGQATDIVQEQPPEKALDLSKLTDEELDAFERILKKASLRDVNVA